MKKPLFSTGRALTSRYLLTVCLLITMSLAPLGSLFGQKASTSSPYSRFGIGELRGSQLPQTRAMGGIAAGIRHMGMYSNINTDNPASYSALQFTVIDAGVLGNIAQLSNRSHSENSYNFALSHINLAFPLGRFGGISMGVKPFSDVGYNYAVPDLVDTTSINKVYAGEGGTNAAYLGYGFRLSPNVSVGVNFNYIFGNLTAVRSLEFPDQVGSLNSREDQKNYINGLSIGYGAQYFKPLNDRLVLVLGYNGTAGGSLNSKNSLLVVRTPSSVSDGTAHLPVDTISFSEGDAQKIRLPFRHRAGFTLSHSNRWMVGADFTYDQWSSFESAGVNQGLNDSYGVAVGGQFTPDATGLNYLSVIDYRLGFRYTKTHIQLNQEDVNEMAVTVGMGLPLPSMFGISFNRVNLSAELGQRGRVTNQLIRERFVNFSLGFTLNDRWFNRLSYD